MCFTGCIWMCLTVCKQKVHLIQKSYIETSQTLLLLIREGIASRRIEIFANSHELFIRFSLRFVRKVSSQSYGDFTWENVRCDTCHFDHLPLQRSMRDHKRIRGTKYKNACNLPRAVVRHSNQCAFRIIIRKSRVNVFYMRNSMHHPITFEQLQTKKNNFIASS